MSYLENLWVCRWPNGEVSIAYGWDKDEVIEALDQEAGAVPEWIEPYKEHTFYVGYTPMKDDETGEISWQACDIPEEVFGVLGSSKKAFAKLHKRGPGDPIGLAPDDDSVDNQLLELQRIQRRFDRSAKVKKAPPQERDLWRRAEVAVQAAIHALGELGRFHASPARKETLQ